MKANIEDKPEIFYFGHVIGATGATEGDGIFLKFLMLM